MPKKAAKQESTTASVRENVARGTAETFIRLKAKIEEDTAHLEELKAGLKELVKRDGVLDGKHSVLQFFDGLKLVVQRGECETFSVEAAMELLNELPEKTALKYVVKTTTKDMMAVAYNNGDIKMDDLENLISSKPTEALVVKKPE